MQITINLDDQEQAALRQLIDLALRHSGSGALAVAAHFSAKLEIARRGEPVEGVGG
jgi:hypothetical protein